MMTEPKPLRPLESGIILLVGTKASNFSDEIRNHPRIVMWDSQQEHWTNKDMPSNTRAVFMTRFMGHSAFTKIVTEARKKNITIFNPTGTGIIVRQVRELLGLNLTTPRSLPGVVLSGPEDVVTKTKETVVTDTTQVKGKLKALIPFLDFAHSNVDNARKLIGKAKEMGIETTIGSLSQLAMVERRKQGASPSPMRLKARVLKPKVISTPPKLEEAVDVSVEILDNLIKGLQDMRAFFVATVNENNELRARVDKFKKAMEGI